MVRLRVYRVILAVRAHKPDINQVFSVYDLAQNAVLVASDIENYPAMLEDACAPVSSLDVLRRPPVSAQCFLIPGLEALFAFWEMFPKLYKRAPRNNPHPGIIYYVTIL
jgi:hypothetical protein